MSTEEEFRRSNRQCDPERELAGLRQVAAAAREFVARYDADWGEPADQGADAAKEALDTLRHALATFRKTEQDRVGLAP